MNTRSQLACITTALLCMLAQGCADLEGESAEEQSETSVLAAAAVAKGSMCVTAAYATKPTQHCVPSGGDPAEAFRAARADCEATKGCNPATAEYTFSTLLPAGVDYQAALRNKEMLAQFVADETKLQTLASTLSATQYNYALGNHVEGLVTRLRDDQVAELNRPAPNLTKPLDRFEATLRKKAAAEIDPLVMEYANTSQAVPKIQAALTWAQNTLAKPQAEYTAMVARFSAYRASEATVARDLEQLSLRASAAQLADLAEITVDLGAYSGTSAETPDQLMLDASRLRATLESIESSFRRRIEPYHDFIGQHLGEQLELTTSAQASLANMVAYAEQRRSQTQGQLATLAQGLSGRREALLSLAEDAATQKTLRDAAFLKASGAFLDEATVWVRKIGELPEVTSKYSYKLWTSKHDQCEELLQLEPLCGANDAGARPSWRDAGCNSFRRTFGTARNYVTDTIPQLIRLTIPQLRRNGVSETMLAKITDELSAGNVRAALVAYDAAALATEAL